MFRAPALLLAVVACTARGGFDDGGDASAPCQAGNQTLIVSDDLDDGEIELNFNVEWFPSGEVDFPGIDFAGHSTAIGGPTWTYLRFALDRTVPASALVQAATLRVYATSSYGWDPAEGAIYIRAELTANAPAVSGRNDAPELSTGRPLTSTTVRWPAAGGLSWPSDRYQTSPSLVPLLNELTAGVGDLAAGAYVQLWLNGAAPPDGEIGLEDFASPTAHLAELSLSWTCP